MVKKRQAGNIGEEQTTADQSVEFKKASLVWGYLGGEIETGAERHGEESVTGPDASRWRGSERCDCQSVPRVPVHLPAFQVPGH